MTIFSVTLPGNENVLWSLDNAWDGIIGMNYLGMILGMSREQVKVVLEIDFSV